VAIEKQIEEAYPDWEVRRAFTSRMIIKKLAQRDGEKIDYISEAIERLILDGIKTVVIQPTLITNGTEYDDIAKIVSEYRCNFHSLSLGKPLLTSNEDYGCVADTIERTLIPEAESIAGKGTAVIMMGHGSEHYANSSYSQLYLKLLLSGFPNVFITTVEGFPDFDDTIALMENRGYKDVVLFPFMLVAGDHANNDMAGEEEDSLRSVMEGRGYNVNAVVKGMGEYIEFRDLFLAHVKDAMESL
jgi:sirohydrochlorin cobaltochelatase